jgi:hypothetical protein
MCGAPVWKFLIATAAGVFVGRKVIARTVAAMAVVLRSAQNSFPFEPDELGPTPTSPPTPSASPRPTAAHPDTGAPTHPEKDSDPNVDY